MNTVYQELFNHLQNEHGLILVESELQEIIRISCNTVRKGELDINGKAFTENQQYRVEWQNREGTCFGHGEPIDAISAKSWIEKANKDYPFLFHWARPIETPEFRRAEKERFAQIGIQVI